MPPVLDNYHKILIDCFEAFLFEFLFLIYNFEKKIPLTEVTYDK